MPKVKVKESRDFKERVSLFLRNRTDLERNFYIQVRQVLDPATAVRRRMAVVNAPSAPFEIPRERGFVLFPPGKFPELPAVVEAAQESFRTADLEAVNRSNKSFMINILEPSRLTPESPFLQFALREDVLAGISRYL